MAKGRGGRTSRGEEYKRNQRILEQMKNYGLDPEDFDDFVALGDRPGQVLTGGMEGLVPVAPYTVDDGKGAAWDKRLKELQDRAKKRRDAQKQRDIEDYDARIRRQETPTQAEARKAAEAVSQTTTQTPVAATPVPTQPSAPSTTALNPASGVKRASTSTRAPLVSVNKNGRTGTTITVNGQGMRPTTENMNLVESLQRRRLTDNVNPNLSDAVITNAELRQFQRENGQIALDRARWARRDEILKRGRERSDQISWNRGEVRNARDWEHYGTVASAEGWKKGSEEYNNAMTALREKMKAVSDPAAAAALADDERVVDRDVNGQVYVRNLGSPGRAASMLVDLINGSDAGAGLSQKQIEVANAQLDRIMKYASDRRAAQDAGRTYRLNQTRERLGLAEGTSDKEVMDTDRRVRGAAVGKALDALSDPSTWNTPDYYKHLETIRTNSDSGSGLEQSFRAAMRDPETRRSYNEAVTRMAMDGGKTEDLVSGLRDRFAVSHMMAQRTGGPQLSTRAAQGAGPASGSLRPRKEYASDKERYRDMSVVEKLVRAGELLKQYEGTDKYDAFKKRYDAMLEKYGPQVQAVKQGVMEADPTIGPKVAEAVAERMPWDYERNRIATPQIGRPDGTIDRTALNAIASSPIPERVTRGLGTSVASAQPAPTYRTDLGGLGVPGSVWLQPLRPRGKGVL